MSPNHLFWKWQLVTCPTVMPTETKYVHYNPEIRQTEEKLKTQEYEKYIENDYPT